MTGIQGPESVTHTPNELRKNALRITFNLGSLLSSYAPEISHRYPRDKKENILPIIESNTSNNKGKTYKHGIQIPLKHKIYKALEIGIGQSTHEIPTSYSNGDMEKKPERKIF